MEGELLEQVVVEPGAGRDAHAARAVEREPDAQRVSAVARRSRTRRGPRRRPARAGRARGRAPRAAGRRPRGRAPRRGSRRAKTRTTQPERSSAAAERVRLGDGHEEEVRRATAAARGRARAARRRAARAPRPRPRRRAARRARRARARRRASRPGTAPGGGSARRRSRRRRARSRRGRRPARTPSRTCAARRRRRRAGPTAVSPAYSQYASSTTSGRAAGRSTSAPLGLCGRQQNVTTGSSSPTSAPASSAAMRNSGYVGSSAIATRSPGPGEGARAEQDQVVGARAEDDVLRADARRSRRSPSISSG